MQDVVEAPPEVAVNREEIQRQKDAGIPPGAQASALRAALGLPAVARSAIFPVVLGEPQRALDAAARLRERGLLVKPIRPPTVPEGTSRLRFALAAGHTEAHVQQALEALGGLEVRVAA